jgi:hypothetical protein
MSCSLRIWGHLFETVLLSCKICSGIICKPMRVSNSFAPSYMLPQLMFLVLLGSLLYVSYVLYKVLFFFAVYVCASCTLTCHGVPRTSCFSHCQSKVIWAGLLFIYSNQVECCWPLISCMLLYVVLIIIISIFIQM